ncbi:hypothetical protein PAPHI01_2578 [Pancytospora philotis]|nr:hypothetical protein PAPHI01_2578 [Pancytospora philotis]
MIMAVFRLWHWGLPKDLIPDVLPVSKAAIGSLMKRASTSVVEAYYKDAGLLGGPGIIVEVDESKFGKRKYHRGHRIEGLWVFGMVERTPERRSILIGVENREGETLIGAMLRYVHPASIIHSDGWIGYSRVKEHFAAHFVVNYSRHFVDLLTGAHTNTIEGNWSAVKAKIPRRSRTVELAPIYLIRFMLMRNEGKYSILTLIKYLFR